MNQHLQGILQIIQENEFLDLSKQAAIQKLLKDADRELQVTAFKLDSVEKVKRTTGVLLEETIAELEQKRKAVEAQNRELAVEAALERVRSKSMGMQHSSELDHMLRAFHEQVLLLGIESAFSFLWLPDEEKDRHIFWAAWAEDGSRNFKSKAINYPLDRDEPATAQCLVDWKGKEPVVSYHVPPAGVEGYFAAWQELIAGVEQLKPEYFSEGLYYVEAFMMYGCFGVMVRSVMSDDEKRILGRFASEFERTYTRFLDLKKAESQAREAQIEAALERVRSRSMGMQKSEELKEVIQVVYQQFVHLNINVEHAGFYIDYKDHDDMHIWLADPNLVPYYVTLPYFDTPTWDSFLGAKKNGVSFFTNLLNFEEKNRFYESLFKLFTIPEESQQFYLQCKGLAVSTVLLDSVGLYIENFSAIPYTDEENKILVRITKVFQQTYTRFLDLQKAEQLALETMKRASVDRIRAEIASMRTVSDLDGINPLLWRELRTVNVPFIRCGVFIMDEEREQVRTMLSTADGKAIAAFSLPFGNTEPLPDLLPSWHRKEAYQLHWDEAAFMESSRILMQRGAIESAEQYAAEHQPKELFLYFLPFQQGMLYVGNEASIGEAELQLVQNLADAFAIAYARYEDFSKLEAAKEQVERTLIDLKKTQVQLVQSEKMASLGELTAGIAHEIQNPLNFVNNFSEVNKEIIDEVKSQNAKVKSQYGEYPIEPDLLDDLEQNMEKINHHGKRADGIVKSMLQHSRTSSGQKEPTDLAALADEYLKLAYHGMRAKDKDFNVILETDFAPDLPKVNVIPQDIGRVLLNLYNNAFQAVMERKNSGEEGYEPKVRAEISGGSTAETRRRRELGLQGAAVNSEFRIQNSESITLRVIDNGPGISEGIRDKIFQPFFTTKPTGLGTGLGLSLSYDIVKKGHAGELTVGSEFGKNTIFTVELPV